MLHTIAGRAYAAIASLVAIVALSVVAPGCAGDFDTSRSPPRRGSTGEEIFGLVCDRVGAQDLREDLSGASFHAICHRATDGSFADRVDTSRLPTLGASATDARGKAVSLEDQRAARARAVARVEALARRRADLVAALDAAIPEETIRSACGSAKGARRLTEGLAELLGRMGELYRDETLPQTTRSLAHVLDAFAGAPEARAAWARTATRAGYRPAATALGATTAALRYPELRALANETLRVVTSDGPGHDAFVRLVDGGRVELSSLTVAPRPAPLTTTFDAASGRTVLSRPRTGAELMMATLLASSPAFARSAAPGPGGRFVVRRDARGAAVLAGSTVTAPFADADGDGLPDLDALGRFVTRDGSAAPTPFAIPGLGAGGPFGRDAEGRATVDGRLVFDHVAVPETFASQLLSELPPLLDSAGDGKHETLFDLAAGLVLALGPRAPMQARAGTQTLAYEGIDPKRSPVLDLLHAAAAIAGDRSTDATLALSKRLLTSRPNAIARAAAALTKAADAAQSHPEAKIEGRATFWDDALDTLVAIAKEPGLVEDVLRAFAAPETAKLGPVLARYATSRDELSYDRAALDGPPVNLTTGDKGEMRTPVDRSKPVAGKNRSALHRFLSLVNDTTGVTACNKPQAVVHAKLGRLEVNMPIIASGYKECEVFKLENVASAYIDAIANAAQFEPPAKLNKRGAVYLRDDNLREGIALGIGAATVELMQNSSGMSGFWTKGDSKLLAAKPEYLNRLVFFDLANDSPKEGDRNYRTNHFVRDLIGGRVGSSACAERTIPDPLPNAPDASPDGRVHGLRVCPDGQWLEERHPNTAFTLEALGFFDAIRPLVTAFVKHGREDLFIQLSNVLYAHWPSADATAGECALASGKTCPRTGLHHYEPLLADMLAGDLVPALTKLAGEVVALEGVDAVAASLRAVVDPDHARNKLDLVDRTGARVAQRNDGTTNPQVTPIYLVTAALRAVDASFDGHEEERAAFRRARSQLVDRLLAVDGEGDRAELASATARHMTPIAIDLLRSELWARCPRSFVAPYESCAWTRREVVARASEILASPAVAPAVDLLDALRRDPGARREAQRFLRHLLPELAPSTVDLAQLLSDEADIVPLLRAAGAALDRPGDGGPSLVEAAAALLAKTNRRVFDEAGREVCEKEIDASGVVPIVLGHFVTPMKEPRRGGATPLEVVTDVIAEVNRVDPTRAGGDVLDGADFAAVAAQISSLLVDKERGLEQLYEVLRLGARQ